MLSWQLFHQSEKFQLGYLNSTKHCTSTPFVLVQNSEQQRHRRTKQENSFKLFVEKLFIQQTRWHYKILPRQEPFSVSFLWKESGKSTSREMSEARVVLSHLLRRRRVLIELFQLFFAVLHSTNRNLACHVDKNMNHDLFI